MVSPRISLLQALSWIVGSTFLITGSAYMFIQDRILKPASKEQKDPVITALIQTGPQREALRSDYLAELIGISRDRPVKFTKFDIKKGLDALLSSPLIQQANIKIIKPSSLYVDYAVRQPIAWVYDFENMGIDKEGFLVPMYPFFPPKCLPELYLGLSEFQQAPSENFFPTAKWNASLQSPALDLAFDILHRLQPLAKDLFIIKRIDVSKAFEKNLGLREIVITVENELILSKESAPVLLVHYLRLSAKNYPQELGNYSELRKKIIEEDVSKLTQNNENSKQKIIDLRLTCLAFIENL
ncbi:MAG: hypothetical protein EBZ47_01715 [Chlamydiae bacterium]|nr:hypothetical protein [Chlamydiota bacterium]